MANCLIIVWSVFIIFYHVEFGNTNLRTQKCAGYDMSTACVFILFFMLVHFYFIVYLSGMLPHLFIGFARF